MDPIQATLVAAGGAAGISSSDPYGYSGTTGYVKIVYKRLGG